MRRLLAFLTALFTFFSALFTGDGHVYRDCYVYNEMVYGDSRGQELDLCLPRGKSETGLILLIHGGAWVSGNKEVYRDRMHDYCTRLGYAAATINYRFLSEDVSMADILYDITLALKKIQSIANKKEITLTGMLLTGHSAGGHLAELYAYQCTDISPIVPKAVVAEAGPADLTDKNMLLHNALGNPESLAQLFSNACGYRFTAETMDEALPYLEKISPIYYVRENSVPTLLCHGMKETVVPYAQAVALTQKLEACGVPHDFVSFPNSNHGLDRDPDCSAQAQVLFERYAQQYLS